MLFSTQRPAPDDMVYLDHAATTPLASEALAAMLPFLGEFYGNPSGLHSLARKAREAVSLGDLASGVSTIWAPM